METTKKEHSFSLFRPVSEYGRRNRNLILTLLTIWFLSIFGFQLLLRILEKPTPEEALLKFGPVWEKVKTGTAIEAEKNDFINAMIMVAGKSSVKKEHKLMLDKSISWSVYQTVGDSVKMLLIDKAKLLAETRDKLSKANDKEYFDLQEVLRTTKGDINALANEPTGKDPMNLKESILPYSLVPEDVIMGEEDWKALPGIMELYLTHNQSVLTDTKFLGFPFHYFYTAEFLLILFVGLSLFYSIRITQLQKKYSITE